MFDCKLLLVYWLFNSDYISYNGNWVRNEAGKDFFLSLLKEWEKLCTKFSLLGSDKPFENSYSETIDEDDDVDDWKEEKKKKKKKMINALMIPSKILKLRVLMFLF